MKCYYEVLGVERDAEAAEIKTSYRKLALKWHPDKNLDKPELAKEQFQTVQNAYEVLSDPQERAWYDSHREQLLRGAGSSFNDDSLDLIPFFTPSCFKGFGDDAKGFYAVYKEVFKKLAAEEVDYLDDPEDIKNIPMFGRADTDYEKVHEFYSYWMSFSTSKSYVWLDKYDVREADNRRILKILEKENNKIRQKARKERNDEIRQLVSFVRRRDKRVLAHTKMLQEKAEENKLKAAKNRQDKLLQRRQELEEAKKRQSDIAVYSMDDFHQQLDQIEKHLAEEFGHSDDEFLTDSEEESNEKASTEKDVDKTPKENGSDAKEKNYSNNVSQGLYCTACNKMFKNVKSFENHENSKKHRENVANMQLDTELDFSGDEEEEDEQALASDSSVKDKLDDDDEDLDLLSEEDDYNVQQLAQSKKKKKKNKKQAVQSDHHSDVEETNLEDLNGGTRSRRARKAKAMEKVISKIKEEKKMASEVTEEKVEETVEGNLESEIVETDDSKELVDKENESTTNETDPKKLDTKKVNKSVKKFSQKQKDVIAANLDVADLDTAHCCAICKNEFPSKNKLFDHLKKTGHQVYLPTAQASVKVNVKASKKKSKK